MKDIVLHWGSLLGLVAVWFSLGLQVDRRAVVGGANRACQEGAVVVRVVPGKPALVHRLLPQRHSELDRFERLLAVEHDRFAVGLDLLAAPRPQVRIPPSGRVAEGVPRSLAIGSARFFQLLARGTKLIPRGWELTVKPDLGQP